MIKYMEYLSKQVEKVRLALPKAFEDAYTTTYALGKMEDLNRRQMEQGGTRDQEDIRPKYSGDYAAYKKRLGRGVKGAPFTPNLRLTGQFHVKLFARPVSGGILFDSSDKKTPELNKRYKRVFGLAKHSIAELNNDPRIKKDIVYGIIQNTTR